MAISESRAPRKYDSTKWLRPLFYFIAIGLGALLAWRTRYRVNSDAMAYLDMGDALVRGDWGAGINGQWSPLYPWVLGMVLLISKPSPYWESSVAHLVNFAIYCCALLCFEFFFRELRRNHQMQEVSNDGKQLITLPEWAWLMLGYALFIGSSLILIRISVLSPDMSVAAFVYLASGILLRIRRGVTSWLTFVLLGTVLGLGYLAKAPMFILAFVFITMSGLLVNDLKRAAPRVAIALVSFLLITSIYFIPLSRAKGRWSFGDSGKLNMAWHMNGLPYLHWQGEPSGNGTPRHPTRKLLDSPEIYEFAGPVGGTYPPWYDPSYWYEGVRPHFEVKQLKLLFSNAIDHYHLFVYTYQIGLIFGFLVLLLYMSGGWRPRLKRVTEYWCLLVPAIAALGMYWLVHVEGRYLSPFVILLWAGLFSGARLPASAESTRVLTRVTIALMIVMVIEFAHPLTILTESEQAASRGHVQWQVAGGLSRIGIQPGDAVATLGSGYTAYWARLARVKIVAETRQPNSFWEVDNSLREEAIKAFAGVGAKAIVATGLPGGISTDGWQKVGDTDYYVYVLSR